MIKALLLAGLFALTALLYASVGFGGGSTYTALLIASGTDYRIIPLIALTCNILVVSGNCVRYARQRLIKWGKLLPLIALSIPAAWLGGRLAVSETIFIGLLWVALMISGARLLIVNSYEKNTNFSTMPTWQSAAVGMSIGFYSGLVGIGGGIFLAPLLHFKKWGNSKTIAAACSLFILVNSVAGFAGQATKLASADLISNAFRYWPVLPAVVIGGFIGNRFGVFNLSQNLIKRVTALLILLVAFRLAMKWFELLV